jgi:hypothetical protein
MECKVEIIFTLQNLREEFHQFIEDELAECPSPKTGEALRVIVHEERHC